VNVRRVAVQLGELLAHRVDGDRGQLVHKAGRRGRPATALRAGQQPQVTHRAAQQPPQDVPATFVGGQHAVLDQHHGAAHMVGDDPQ
jgi:hypothetical protein